MSSTNPTPRDPLDNGSVAVSLAFWLVLFAAGVVYAAVALAPKLAAHAELHQHYVENQIRLVELERRNVHLERVCEALEEDPDFAEEFLRAEFDAAEPGEERISVDPGLHLESRPAAASITVPSPPWYQPLARRLADDEPLRRRLLYGVALVVVLAFAILHDANGGLLRRVWNDTFGTLFRFVRGRYGVTREVD